MEILLLERLVPEAQAWLEARHALAFRPELADDPAALRKLLYNVQGLVLPRKVAVTRELLDFAPVLRVIARTHFASDNVDLEACRDRRVRVVQALNAHVRSHAEFLLASLLTLMRPGIAAAAQGDRRMGPTLGREVHGCTVGLLGLSPAAHALALMLQALGARVIGYDPAVHRTATLWERLKVGPVHLNELMEQSDCVSVQMLYGSRYQGFINGKVLASCKPGQLWVGTTRTGLFEPQALAAALRDGRIGAALLDGADGSFAGRGSPLADAPNLFLTPRIGSLTRESRQRASWYVVQRVHEALSRPATGNTGFDALFSAPMGLEPDAEYADR